VYDDLRLPVWIVPLHYDLTINTYLDVFAYDGSVSISLNLTKPTNLVVFHAVDFANLKVSIQGKSYLPIFNKKREYWIVYLDSELGTGLASLSIEFKGTLSDSLRGYYGAKVHTGNSSYYIATTQFEPTDARRAFPCFDEPAMKATFNITMVVQKGYHALSNMPIKAKESLDSGMIKTVFHQTKRMSTYLIAFIVSDFEAVRGKTFRGN
jgi:aminopeptidase N